MKKMFILLLVISSLFSNEIKKPFAQFEASGSVTDMVYKENKLYSATDASCVDIFDIKIQKIIKKITVEQITDFMGDVIDSKVYSVDLIENKILLLSQGKKGARRVHIYENKTLNLVLPDDKGLFIAKAKFLNSNTIILGLLSNEIISYNIKEKKQNYRIQVSQSKFSDFVLNEDKTKIIVADESGTLKIHETKDGSFLEELSGQNLDNVFQVDTKNGIIATAGQDRRVVIYAPEFDSAYYKTSKFLIYSVGLSPSGNLVAYSSNEINNVTVFNTINQNKIEEFGGNKMVLSKILFINENEFFVSSDSTTINQFKIK